MEGGGRNKFNCMQSQGVGKGSNEYWNTWSVPEQFIIK